MVRFSTFVFLLMLGGCTIGRTMPMWTVPLEEDKTGAFGVSYAAGSLDTLGSHNVLWMHLGFRNKQLKKFGILDDAVYWFNFGGGTYSEEGRTYYGGVASFNSSMMTSIPFDWFSVEFGIFTGFGMEMSNYVRDFFGNEPSDERGVAFYPWIYVGAPLNFRLDVGDKSSVSLGFVIQDIPPVVFTYGRFYTEPVTVFMGVKYRLYSLGFFMSY